MSEHPVHYAEFADFGHSSPQNGDGIEPLCEQGIVSLTQHLHPRTRLS